MIRKFRPPLRPRGAAGPTRAGAAARSVGQQVAPGRVEVLGDHAHRLFGVAGEQRPVQRAVLAVVGVNAPADVTFDGEALPEILLGQSTSSRTRPLFFRRPPDRDAFYGVDDLPDLAVRDGNWKLLCEYDGSDASLFDLDADPEEANNQANQHPDVVQRLTKKLIAWHVSMPPDKGATYSRIRRRN